MILLNNVEITPTKFPDGTSQVWKLGELISPLCNKVVWEFSREAELIHICQLSELLNKYTANNFLEITYLPYARQDKEVSDETTFAFSTFRTILVRSTRFRSISVFDPHNYSAAKAAGFLVLEPKREIQNALEETNSTLVVFPDASAHIKYKHLISTPSVVIYKTREQSTGKIVDVKLSTDFEPVENLLIVDDICDGGATFIAACDILKGKAQNIHLYVSHGLFTKGLKPLHDAGIKRVFDRNGEVFTRSSTGECFNY